MKRFTPAIALALLFSGAAIADDSAQNFSEMDADRNGKLDRQEAQSDPNLQVYFGRADADADGAVTLTEYQTFATDLARARQGVEQTTPEEVPAE